MTPDTYVDNEQTLGALVTELRSHPLLALDTEFVRESTYFPKLCLVQIATEESIACVDCLAPLDFAPLFETLFEPGRTWLMHSARQDLEVLSLASHRSRAPGLIDTQIAAALCGYAPQIGLQDLLREAIGVELSKGYARTDWTLRPLPDAALRYAFDDVRFLLSLWRELSSRLARLGRENWFAEDCAAALDEPLVADPTVIWSRLGGVHALNKAEQYVALALVRWRERTAQQLDRPRRWILQDPALLELARARPSKLEELARVASLPPRLVERRGDALLQAVAEAEDPALRAVVDRWPPPEAPDKSRVQALAKRAKARATELGIAAEVLATRRDIVELVRTGSAGRTPWRSAELGALRD